MVFEDLLVSKDEVLVYAGLDLADTRNDDNPSNKVERLIYKAQSQLFAFINANYHRDLYKLYHYQFSARDREHVKIAISLQCEYIIENGNLGTDMDLYEKDSKANFQRLNARKICPDAIDELSQIKYLMSNKVKPRNFMSEFMEIELHNVR